MGPSLRPRPERPLGFAHRGARRECRDNTLRSFDRALELGARALESDVWLTADNIVVLDHDGLVRRGVRRVAIRDLPRAALPPHIPSLADLQERIDPGVDISLDVKDPGAAVATIELVEAADRAARTWLCGTGASLLQWRSRSAQIRLVDSTQISRVTEGLADRVEHLAAGGVDAVNLRWPEWDAARLATVHDAGLLAFAWDTQRAATIASMVDLGIDGVYSDHVDRMVATLEQRRDRPPDGRSEPVDA